MTHSPSARIPAANPLAGYLAHKAEIDRAIAGVLTRGAYILGPEVAAFERELGAWLGVAHVVGVASGTAALQVALRSVGVGTGDAVVTAAHTAVATVAAIELCGATPVLVDVEPATLTLDPERLDATLRTMSGRRVRAIIPVHLYGHPAALPQLQEVAARHGVVVVEDCAQALGATVGGAQVGTAGTLGAFSFYPTKNLGALGDAGAVVTNSAELAELARRLRQYGWRERYVSQEAGLNSRLAEIQAAVLRVKLQYLEVENERRRALARRYAQGLRATPVQLPTEAPEARHVYHQYVVRLPARDHLRTFLAEHGVDTLVHYPVPVHLQPAYRDRLLLCAGGLPETTRACGEVLSLPLFPELADADVDRVCELIRAFIAGAG